MKCWVENSCKGYPKSCNQFCEGYVILEVAYKQSNIPLRYQYPQQLIVDADDEIVYSKIKSIMDNIGDYVERGHSLLLYGDHKGNGKTSLACALANAYIKHRVKTKMTLEPVVYFIRTAKFLEEMRKQFNEPTIEFPTKLKMIETVDLLIIDDIGAEKPSDWVREQLLNIIDERYSNNRTTIYTSNFSIPQIEENLHGRIADRLNDCEKLQFKGKSKRGLTL